MAKTSSMPYCPSCDQQITDKEINITEGVALCSQCGKLSQLSTLNYLEAPVKNNLSKTPRKVKIHSSRDQLKLHISLRSIGIFLGSLFTSVFWNGITSLFLCIAVSAVCYNTIGYVPEWLPKVGIEDGRPIMNDEVMGPGITIGLCIFLIPFVTIGLYMISLSILSIFGSCIITIDKKSSSISTGILFLRRTKSFTTLDVQSIQIENRRDDESTHNQSIKIASKNRKDLKFGSLMNTKLKQWVYLMLKQLLIHKDSSKLTREFPILYWLK